jgi:putative cardiolipin synthase
VSQVPAESRSRNSRSTKQQPETSCWKLEGIIIGKFDPRSVYENSEIGLLIKSTQVASELTQWYEDYSTNNSYRVFLQDSWSGMKLTRWERPGSPGSPVLKNEPDSGILLRAGIHLIQFLPIESQL